ncbi:hypothetical protein KSS87_008687 [Heliosperma pusillum]|nr:hypothetical protein KSS87_008687 [Heliosperma pusillum]
MFKNTFQSGFLSILYSLGSKPLQIWDKEVSNGHIKRPQDDDIQSNVLEIVGSNIQSTYITCPADPAATLGIKLPFLVMVVKNLKKYFTFEIQILDDRNVRRRFRASNYQVSEIILNDRNACTLNVFMNFSFCGEGRGLLRFHIVHLLGVSCARCFIGTPGTTSCVSFALIAALVWPFSCLCSLLSFMIIAVLISFIPFYMKREAVHSPLHGKGIEVGDGLERCNWRGIRSLVSSLLDCYVTLTLYMAMMAVTRVKPYICTMPLKMDDGWNQIQLNLGDFTKRAYGTNYVETLRVQVHANCRLRRIYFSDRLYSEEELPPEFKLYLPMQACFIEKTLSCREVGKLQQINSCRYHYALSILVIQISPWLVTSKLKICDDVF